MKIAIIGGGAAGLMCAAQIRERAPEAEVILIEKNDGLGKKVIISGGGRCNVTTGIHDIRTVLTKYPRGSKFLFKAMHHFPPESVYAWFEQHGVPLKTEDDLRVFPQSDDGKDIVRAFETLLDSSQATIALRTQVNRIEKIENQFFVYTNAQSTPIIVDKLVLTTGGQAYRHTGSTGDGYAFALSLGHSLTKLAPSLNAFFTQETWPAALSGLSFEKATFTTKREKTFSFTGPFLFTHKGVSGPAVFALSSLIAFEHYDAQQPLTCTIDLFPDRSQDEMRELVATAMKTFPKKNVINALASGITRSLAEVLCQILEIPWETHAAEVSKKDTYRIADWLKCITLHVIARGAGDEFVTAGGIDLREVDPSTMESKICPGLFFAGEILDIDGFTGGFNLQASWATGYLAGEHVTK